MKNLYEQYGELMVQLELLQSKIKSIKQQIVGELNNKAIAKEPEKE